MMDTKYHYNASNIVAYTHNFAPASLKTHLAYQAESHQMVEIMLILQGQMHYLIDGAKYTANAGDMIVINAGEFHSSRPSNETFCEKLILHFSTAHIPSFKSIASMNAFTKASLYQHIIPQEIIKKTKILSLFKKIETLCKSEQPYKDLKLFSLVIAFVAELNYAVDMLTSKKYNYISSPTTTNDPFNAAIDYINKNIQTQLAVATIAQYVGVSESYLHRLFKKNMGISILNYIKNQKMQLALSLLRKGYSAQTVSEMVGYEYYATFSNVFKTIFGKTPNQFK